MSKPTTIELSMTPFNEKSRMITHTTYECELNGRRITVTDVHHGGRTRVYFPNNSSIEFPNQIESRASLPYDIWLLRKLSKLDDIEERLSPPKQGVKMNKLAPSHRFDQLQAWKILIEFLDMNPHLPRADDRPQIVKDAIEALDKSIDQGMEGEQEIDEDGNRVGEPEIVMYLSECQSELWNKEMQEYRDELSEELPLWKEKVIRIKEFCQSYFQKPNKEYNYEVILPDKTIGYHGIFKAEKWMSRENIQNAIAEMFCPPGYNFNSKSMTFHFENHVDVVYTFNYNRSGNNESHKAAGW